MAKRDFEFELGRNPNFIPKDDYKKINETIIPRKPNFFDEPITESPKILSKEPSIYEQNSFKDFLVTVEAENRYRFALTMASLGASIDGISEKRRHQIEAEILGKAK